MVLASRRHPGTLGTTVPGAAAGAPAGVSAGADAAEPAVASADAASAVTATADATRARTDLVVMGSPHGTAQRFPRAFLSNVRAASGAQCGRGTGVSGPFRRTGPRATRSWGRC